MLHFSRLAFLTVIVVCSTSMFGQNQSTQPASADAAIVTDYPLDRPGIFIQSQSWQAVQSQMPVKTRAAHSFAASFSYGIVPAKVVAEYNGVHAATQTDVARPTICICHIISLPGEPIIVRLHVKKTGRELDGGKMVVYPVMGGSKLADANKSDLILVDVQKPGDQIWLVRPQEVLEPGEYALMLGTQNIAIYPFSVTAPVSTK